MIARWMIVGFVLWAGITWSFAFIGQDYFTEGPASGISWMFMIAPLVMFALTYLVLKLFKVDPSDRAEAASIFAVPGLLIGIYQINSFDNVFDRVPDELNGQFAALMFACYAAVIIAGIVSSRLKSI
jgi:hypothetical protein